MQPHRNWDPFSQNQARARNLNQVLGATCQASVTQNISGHLRPASFWSLILAQVPPIALQVLQPPLHPRASIPTRQLSLARDCHLPMQVKPHLPESSTACPYPRSLVTLGHRHCPAPPNSVLHVNRALCGQGDCRIQVDLARPAMHLQELGWVLLLQG